MSYSVSARGATREAAAAAIGAQLDEVLASQPIHKPDLAAAKDAIWANLQQLAEPAEGEEYHIQVTGSVGWQGALDEAPRVTSVYTNLDARIIAKVVPT